MVQDDKSIGPGGVNERVPEGEAVRMGLRALGKKYQNSEKGYRLVYKMLFGDYDPWLRGDDNRGRGVIELIRSLDARLKKFNKRSTLIKKMPVFSGSELEIEDNGND